MIQITNIYDYTWICARVHKVSSINLLKSNETSSTRNDDPNRRVYDIYRKIAFIMNLMNYHKHIRLKLYP